MLRRERLIAALTAVTLSCTGCGRLIQQTVLLHKMRSQYYDMRAAGAKSFSCTARPDWPLFVSSATGTPSNGTLPDSPWHRYLQGVTLSFHASLIGGTDITWDEKTPPPADKKDPAQKLQGAFKRMLEGFITAWRPSLSNTLLPSIPVSEITTTPSGYSLTEKDMQGRISDLTIDKAMQVTHISVHGTKLNVESDTKFVRSPKGLLLTEMDNAVKEPNGSTSHSVIRTSFDDVNGFAMPSMFEVDTEHTRVHMDFTGCKVEK